MRLSGQSEVDEMLALRHLQPLNGFVDGSDLFYGPDSFPGTLDPQQDLHSDDTRNADHGSVPLADRQVNGGRAPKSAPP